MKLANLTLLCMSFTVAIIQIAHYLGASNERMRIFKRLDNMHNVEILSTSQPCWLFHLSEFVSVNQFSYPGCYFDTQGITMTRSLFSLPKTIARAEMLCPLVKYQLEGKIQSFTNAMELIKVWLRSPAFPSSWRDISPKYPGRYTLKLDNLT
jgi:hypothetical protein